MPLAGSSFATWNASDTSNHKQKVGMKAQPRLMVEELEERIAPSVAPGQLGYEGQPGNQGNGQQGYEGQPGNQGNGQKGYEGQPGNQGGKP